MPSTLTTPTTPEQILSVARAMVAGREALGCSAKNAPLLPVLEALISAATVQADAVADNAWDDCRPIPAEIARDLAQACHRLGDTITAAAAAPDASGWSLPSMTGKELV
jgi:hypothetical protein